MVTRSHVVVRRRGTRPGPWEGTMTAIAPTAPLIVETAALETVSFDLYRNVHKGIRHGLFSVTFAAGEVDPHDAVAVRALSERWTDLVGVLVAHAEHEDEFVQPVIERCNPDYAAEIAEA